MFAWPGDARRAARLSDDFARRLGARLAPVTAPGRLVGLEHEYLVRRVRDGRRVNFAHLVHTLAPSARGLDPSDAAAYRLPSGAVLTADETEAELALPPLVTRAGFASRLAGAAAESRNWLAHRLAPRYRLAEGVSTHLSVALPAAATHAVAAAYARSWAPALMLLLDDVDSPGLLVRPRPNRLELCGEFASGPDLEAAALFAVGSALAASDSSGSSAVPDLPPLQLALRMGDQRFGWYVDRRAGGPDLYQEGRHARLTTDTGKSRFAQEHLEHAWSLARRYLHGHAHASELDLLDALVDGRRALRVERLVRDDPQVGHAELSPPSIGLAQTPYGRALGAHGRPGFALAPVMLTWSLAVFVLAGSATGRRAFAAVPGRYLARFLRRLDQGLLDEPIGDYLAARPVGRRLASAAMADRAGLYDAMGARVALLPPERQVVTPGSPA